ncbi:hypothetical protein AO284_25845 [Pseudomonas sp. NZIPFR-PS2]|nr:hypothetical protein AO284_25845 [Pseudomonas sp. NZIPFR-PS2]
MTIINNPAYVDLIQGGDIDIAISPQLATIGTLLAHVRRGDIVSVHSLLIIAHDDTVIETGDHVILFLVDKKHIRDVEKLFHVGLSFF